MHFWNHLHVLQMGAGGCPCTCSIEWHLCICITLQPRAFYFCTWQQDKQKTKQFLCTNSLRVELSIHTIACAMDECYLFWSRKASGCFSTFFLCKADKIWWMVLDGRVVLTSATNQESQKFNFWQSGSSRRFSRHCCTLTEMALFLCALHSKNTRISLTLFVWVFAGTKPFDNMAISSLLVGHLNWSPGSQEIFTFFLGGWKSLRSEFTVSFPTILKMSKTTASCINHSKCVSVA